MCQTIIISLSYSAIKCWKAWRPIFDWSACCFWWPAYWHTQKQEEADPDIQGEADSADLDLDLDPEDPDPAVTDPADPDIADMVSSSK